MIPFNEHWERWCKISIIKNFDSGKGDTSLYVEGFPRNTDNLTDYLEIRVDGPYDRENCKNHWRLYFEVNILIVVKMDIPDYDPYRINRLSGRVQKLFTDDICVKKYGDGPDDDATVLIGHLSLVPRANERIQVSHFGRIRPDTDIIQASVEGHYHIFFD